MGSSNTNTIQILKKKYLNTFKYKYKCIWPMSALDHHGGHKIGSIVFILGTNIAKYDNMPYVWKLKFG